MIKCPMESKMLEEILKLHKLAGVSFSVMSFNYSWEKKPTFHVTIKRDVSGEEFEVKRAGTDIEMVWHSVYSTFMERLTRSYTASELQPNLIEGPKYEEATRAVSAPDDIPF